MRKRLGDGRHLLVEAKGLADLDVPRKDERAARWAVDASVASGVPWAYVRVDEQPFRAAESALTTVRQLLDLVHARRRERALVELEGDRPHGPGRPCPSTCRGSRTARAWSASTRSCAAVGTDPGA